MIEQRLQRIGDIFPPEPPARCSLVEQAQYRPATTLLEGLQEGVVDDIPAMRVRIVAQPIQKNHSQRRGWFLLYISYFSSTSISSNNPALNPRSLIAAANSGTFTVAKTTLSCGFNEMLSFTC
jgi:hypothetical protein